MERVWWGVTLTLNVFVSLVREVVSPVGTAVRDKRKHIKHQKIKRTLCFMSVRANCATVRLPELICFTRVYVQHPIVTVFRVLCYRWCRFSLWKILTVDTNHRWLRRFVVSVFVWGICWWHWLICAAGAGRFCHIRRHNEHNSVQSLLDGEQDWPVPWIHGTCLCNPVFITVLPMRIASC